MDLLVIRSEALALEDFIGTFYIYTGSKIMYSMYTQITTQVPTVLDNSDWRICKVLD